MESTTLGIMSHHARVFARAIAAHQARKMQVSMYANVSRVALLVYDVLLNLGREQRYIWADKFRPSALLYYMVRYPVIAYQIFQITYTPTMTCDMVDKFCFTLSITLTRIAIAASFILRVYAVVPEGIIAYVSVGFLSLVGLLSVILDIVQTTKLSCTQASSPLCLITWGIFGFIRNSGGFRKLSSHVLANLIVRSGALYYVTITALQTGAVILYWLPQGVYSSVLNNYLTPLSTILVAHFLLDLRAMALSSGTTAISSISGPIVFTNPNRKPGQNLSLFRDFEDPSLTVESGWEAQGNENSGGHVESMAWPLEDLARREWNAEA